MCKKSHIKDINPNTGKSFTRCPECRKKKSEYSKQHYKHYYIKNRDKILERVNRYNHENPFNTWISNSKKEDIKCNRYDPNNFITKEHCEHIVELSNSKCYYCLCELNWEVGIYPNRATIERLDNSLGHIIGNCVIACHRCNSSKISNKPFEQRFKLRIVNKTLIEVL